MMRGEYGYGPPMRPYMNDDFFVRPRDGKNKRGDRGQGGPPMMERDFYDAPRYGYGPPMYDY